MNAWDEQVRRTPDFNKKQDRAIKKSFISALRGKVSKYSRRPVTYQTIRNWIKNCLRDQNGTQIPIF